MEVQNNYSPNGGGKPIQETVTMRPADFYAAYPAAVPLSEKENLTVPISDQLRQRAFKLARQLPLASTEISQEQVKSA